MDKTLQELQVRKNQATQRHSMLLEEIQDINDQLKEYEESGTVNLSEVTDPTWTIRVRDARKHKLRELRELELEFDNIKFQQKQLLRAVDTNLAAAFFKVAQHRLPTDLFAQLLKECQD